VAVSTKEGLDDVEHRGELRGTKSRRRISEVGEKVELVSEE